MLRKILFLLLSLVPLAWAQSPSPKGLVLTVIAADKDSTYSLAEQVVEVRELYHLHKDQLPVARIPAQKLTAQDCQRIGFKPSALPIIALMKVSSSQNLEGVVGDPPYIFRNVQRAQIPARILVARWCELSGRAVPQDLRTLSDIYRPHRVFALNVGQTEKEVLTGQQEFLQARLQAGLQESDLPLLSTTSRDGLWGEEEFARLGFTPEAFPLMCLVEMSDSGNPSLIPAQAIVRCSYNARWSARHILRLWARLGGRELSTISEESDRLEAEEASARPGRFQCLARNYRYGVGGRMWLQLSGRITNLQGTEEATVPVTDFRKETDPQPNFNISLELPVVKPGKYQLELEIRDKLGGTRKQLTLPLIVPES